MERPSHTRTALVKSDTIIRPFEWLTSPFSLKPILLLHALPPPSASFNIGASLESQQDSIGAGTIVPRKALHVGSGSSTVSEFLIEDLNFGLVVDVDKDEETMERMRSRWHQRCQQTGVDPARLEFCIKDFTEGPLPYESNYFDLVLDKSTLDCTLCSDFATASLLVQVHRCLAVGGVYLVISFHEFDLLLPLLANLPGAAWEVTCTTLQRQAEKLVPDTRSAQPATPAASVTEPPPFSPLPPGNVPVAAKKPPPAAPASATIPPRPASSKQDPATTPTKPTGTANKKKQLSVLIARKRQVTPDLDFDAVCRHVHDVNDNWFQRSQPLLTRQRKQALQAAFAASPLPLPDAYLVMFTNAEREHLTYDNFLDDWRAYVQIDAARGEGKPVAEQNEPTLAEELAKHVVTFDKALDFLKEMQ